MQRGGSFAPRARLVHTEEQLPLSSPTDFISTNGSADSLPSTLNGIIPAWEKGLRRVQGEEEEEVSDPGRTLKEHQEGRSFLKGLKPRKGLRGRLFK